MKTVLLSGGAGFIGHHTVEHILKNTDWNIVVLDRLSYAGNLNRFTDIEVWPKEGKRVNFVYHDFRSPINDGVISLFGKKVDYIIHMGAETHVARSLSDPIPFAESNVIGTVNMLELAKKLNAQKFIYVSTDEVFGATDGINLHKEGEPHLPSNPYAAGKAGGEDFAYSYYKSFEMPVIITNTMNNLGERQDPEKFMPMAIKKILAGQKVPIHVRKNKKDIEEISSRCWLHPRNHADALLFLLKKGKAGERYNIAGQKLNVLELARFFAKTLKRPLKVEYVDFHKYTPGHDLHYGLDDTKIKNLGWNPPLNFSESMEKATNWIAKRREWLQPSAFV